MASCPSSCRKYLEKMTQLHSETEQMHTEGLKNKFFSDIPDIVGTQLISATWAMCVCLKIKKFKKKNQNNIFSGSRSFFFYSTLL